MRLEWIVLFVSSAVIVLTVTRRLRVGPGGATLDAARAEEAVKPALTLPIAQIEEAMTAALNARQWRRIIEMGATVRTSASEQMTHQMRMMLSQAYFELFRFDDAASVYAEILVAAPTDPEHHANMAQIEVKRGSVPAAIAHLQKAVALDGTKVAYLDELARLYRMNKQHDAARDIRRKVLELESRKYL